MSTQPLFGALSATTNNAENDPHSNVESGPAQILRHALYCLISLFHWCTRPFVIPLSLSCLIPFPLFPYIFTVVSFLWFPNASLLISLPRVVFLGVSAWEIPFPALKISHHLIQEGFPDPLSPALRVDTPSSRCVCLCRAFTLQHCLLLFTHCRPVSVSSGSSSRPGTLLVPQQCLFE